MKEKARTTTQRDDDDRQNNATIKRFTGERVDGDGEE